MVAVAFDYQVEPQQRESKNPIYLPTPFSFASVSAKRIANNEHRLDASAYNMKAMNALAAVAHSSNGCSMMVSLIKKAYVGSRFKRVYTENPDDIPFFLPSDIESVYPKASKHISSKTNTDIDSLRVKRDMLLMSCSGTIGKTSLVGTKLDNQVFSHDLLRIIFKNEYDLGYVYSFLNTEVGLTILQSNNYGAVIDHIEPEHLRNIPIPDAPTELRKKIHKLVTESYALRDQSNELMDKAQAMLYEELHLPPLSDIEPKQYAADAGFNNYSVKTSDLHGRLDASYHLPVVVEITNIIARNAKEVTIVGDKRISKEIFVGNRFKRVYVNKGQGIVYLNGKSINQLNPNGCNKKYLSFTQHEQQIKRQLTIKANTILVTCSGTLGKVVLVPNHWDGWAGTHDLIRIIPADKSVTGYIFCFLNSAIGKTLILRNSYGAVVDHIEPEHLATVPIPILKNESIQSQINDSVLLANELRYQAYLKEKEAMEMMEEILSKQTNCTI